VKFDIITETNTKGPDAKSFPQKIECRRRSTLSQRQNRKDITSTKHGAYDPKKAKNQR